MLRRVARVFRFSLFLVGVSLLLWLPLSFRGYASLSLPKPLRGISVVTMFGYLRVEIMEAKYRHIVSPRVTLDFPERWTPVIGSPTFWPRVGPTEPYGVLNTQPRSTFVDVPLWLLAVVCLAWPVTSLLVRRRRRGPGFAVEVTNDLNQKSE